MKISVSEKGGKNMYKSDLTRLKACMRRAEAGEDVTLGFLVVRLRRTALLQSMNIVMHIGYFNGGRRHFQKQNCIM